MMDDIIGVLIAALVIASLSLMLFFMGFIIYGLVLKGATL